MDFSTGAQNKAARDWSLTLTWAAPYFTGILEWPEEHQITDRVHATNTYVYEGTISSTWLAHLPLKEVLHWEVGQSYRQMAVWKGCTTSREGGLDPVWAEGFGLVLMAESREMGGSERKICNKGGGGLWDGFVDKGTGEWIWWPAFNHWIPRKWQERSDSHMLCPLTVTGA